MTKRSKYKYDVFISYSHKDKEWVQNILLPTLEMNEIKTIIDFRDFEGGASSIAEMERAVKESRKTILVLTPNYIGSAWSGFEANMVSVLDPGAEERRLLPILLKKCDIPLRISYINYIDFIDETHSELQWKKLFAAIRKTPAETKIPTGITLAHRGTPGDPSRDTLIQLRDIMTRCEQFSTNDRVRAMFSEPRLAPFKASIPEGSSVNERVDLLVAFLIDKKLRSGENMLNIFLEDLLKTIPEVEDRYETLKNVLASLVA